MTAKPKPAPRIEYTDDLAQSICIRIAEGEGLSEICRSKGMPRLSTAYKWLHEQPFFMENYTRAREMQADTDADKIGELAAKVVNGQMDPQAARVAIDAYKWSAGKRKPKVYGDKLELGGNVGVTVVLESDADRL